MAATLGIRCHQTRRLKDFVTRLAFDRISATSTLNCAVGQPYKIANNGLDMEQANRIFTKSQRAFYHRRVIILVCLK